MNGRPSIAFKTYTGDTNNPVSEIWERSSDTKSFTSTISMLTSRIDSTVTMKAAYGGSRCYLQAEASKNGQAIRLKGQKILMDADEITVCDENTGNSYVPLNQYPINWSALAHKPDFRYKLCFGAKRVHVQDSVLHESTATFYPAVRVCEIVTQSNGTSTTSYSSCYYFDSGSWKSFDQSEFVTLEF